jgi:Tol biopolymer transport system component
LRSLDSRQPKWAKWTAKVETGKPPEAGDDSRTAKSAADLRGQNKGNGAPVDKLSPASFFNDLKQALKNLLEGSTRIKTLPAERIRIIRDRSFLQELLYVVKNYRNRILVVSFAILGVILAVFVAGRFLSRTVKTGAVQSLQITRITASGKVTEAVISPFGERLAYAVDEGGQWSLIIKELESGKETRIASDPAKEYRGLAFSPDGQWVSYIKSEPDNHSGSLFRKSIGEGIEEGLNRGDSVSASCFSPDSKRIAYISAAGNRSESTLNVGSPENPGVVLAKRQSPSFFYPDGLAWSPNGRVLACVVKDRESGLFLKIIAVEVEGGGESTIVSGRWSEIDQIAWLGNGNGLVIAAKEPTSRLSQLWRVSYPSGEVTRLTRDLNNYLNVSLTYDSERLVSIQSEAQSNIWMASSVDISGQTRQLTTERYDGLNGLAWTPDGRIAYVSSYGGRETIWTSDLSTGKHHPLPVAPEGGQGGEFQPAVSPDGQHIVYIVERPNGSYLWRSELNRRNLKRLTDENLVFYPAFTADGKSVVYSVLREERRVVAKSTIEGGAPMTLVENEAWRPVVSPDGATIACNYWDDTNAQWKIAVLPSEGGQPLMIFDAPGDFQRVIRWMPDGNGLSFIVTRGGSSNIWMQPLEGGAPIQLTAFKTGRIFDFAWSRDGQRIAFAQGSVNSDAVLIQNFK